MTIDAAICAVDKVVAKVIEQLPDYDREEFAYELLCLAEDWESRITRDQ